MEMKTKVYLIRHGETDNNVAHRFMGRTDMPLNDRGLDQAKCLGRALLKVEFDRIYASPYLRAFMTAEQVRGNRDIEIVKDLGLCEIDLGQWEGFIREEIEVKWPGMIELWQRQPDKLEIPDGETFKQVQDRAFSSFKQIVAQERGKTIAIATHMLTIQLLLARLLSIPIAEVWNMNRLDNTSVTVLDLYENNDFEIVSWGDDTHLPDELKNSFVRIAGVVQNEHDAKYDASYDASRMEGRYHFSDQ
jgi:broad specificity phosphatase PhoE